MNFLSRQHFKIRCIHEASLVSEPKLSNVLPQRKNFCGIGEEAI